jgi:hypothetical protein
MIQGKPFIIKNQIKFELKVNTQWSENFHEISASRGIKTKIAFQ